jgi:ketosteroid isomerase-like protein
MLSVSLAASLAFAQSPTDDAQEVARLDRAYQAAVKVNDSAAMGRILADDMVLITGTGRVVTRAQLLAAADSKEYQYEHQDLLEQQVRVWADTAVVTALLWAKGVRQGKPFDYKVWYSDTYVRQPGGWRYVLGQAARPLGPLPE